MSVNSLKKESVLKSIFLCKVALWIQTLDKKEVTVWRGIISSLYTIERLLISSPPSKGHLTVQKTCFSCVLLLFQNLYEYFMGIAVLQVDSLLVFFRRLFCVFKINFVTKSNKQKIFKKPQTKHFLHKATSKEKNIWRRVCFLNFLITGKISPAGDDNNLLFGWRN
jgi:hypothetical protein